MSVHIRKHNPEDTISEPNMKSAKLNLRMHAATWYKHEV